MLPTDAAPVCFQRYNTNLLATTFLTILFLILTTWNYSKGKAKAKAPLQSLCDPIPFVFNTLQFLMRNHLFMERVA